MRFDVCFNSAGYESWVLRVVEWVGDYEELDIVLASIQGFKLRRNVTSNVLLRVLGRA